MYKALTLPYNYDYLEPIIDVETMYLHYQKHYMNYLNKLNITLEKLNYNKNESLISIINNIDQFPIEFRDDILYNAGGVLNHELYFKQFTNKENNIPKSNLKEQIEKQFGSYEELKKALKMQASYVVGSGWTFLVLNKQGELEIMSTSNQETPYLYGLKPVLAIDLWEHAYYLKYHNRREEYVDSIFEIMDFEVIGNNYEEAKKEQD